MRCWFHVSFFVIAAGVAKRRPAFSSGNNPSLFNKPVDPSASQLSETSYSGKLQFHGPGMSNFAFVEFSGSSKYRAQNVGVAAVT
jgi:hypothetical protein